MPQIAGRGFRISQAREPDWIVQLLPGLSDHLPRFYRLMHRYSTRLFLHDLLAHQPPVPLNRLTHYVSETHARRLARMLEKMTLIRMDEEQNLTSRFPVEVTPGWLLEWYLAKVLQDEFQAPSLFNAGLLGTEGGGDYDVLAAWCGRLLYLEAKSAPPRGIHNPQIAAFLERILHLKPDLAVFLNDTHLRMKDKIVLMFEEELIKLKGVSSLRRWPVERVREQIFHIGHAIYICNSKRDVRSNLKTIFHDYLTRWTACGQLFQNMEDEP